MRRNGIPTGLVIALLSLTSGTVIGCSSTTTTPAPSSGYYLSSDTQYVPAGPQFKLTNQVPALEEYKLEREKLRAGLDEESK